MSTLSDDRINYLSHRIQETLGQAGYGSYPDPDKALKEIKRILIGALKADDAVEDLVRQKIANLKRGVAEGSPEWDILYHKYFEEEMAKRGQ
jgi:uncharacterized protein